MAEVKSLPVYNRRKSRNAVKARVYPEKGAPYTGYIIDGRTYKDPEGKERIDYNSRVESPDGRRYVYTRATGGVPDANTAINSYDSGTEEAIGKYRESRALQDRSTDLAVAQTVQNLKQSRAAADRDLRAAKASARRAYLDASNPYGALAQRSIALGLGDSGFAESTQLGLAKEYESAIARAHSDRDNAVREIESAIARAISQGETEKARAWAELEKEIFSERTKTQRSLADMRMDAAESARDDERWVYEQRRKQRELNEERAAAREKAETQAEQERYDRALALVKLGISTDEIAQALGITRGEADGIAYRATAKKSSAASKSGSAGKKSTKENSTAASDEADSKTEDPDKLYQKRMREIRRETRNMTLKDMLRYRGELVSRLEELIRQEGITDARERRRLYAEALSKAIKYGYLTEALAEELEY